MPGNSLIRPVFGVFGCRIVFPPPGALSGSSTTIVAASLADQFSNMKTPEEIEKKMRTYLHHREYDIKPLGTKKIEEMIKSKKSIYNLRADMKNEKIDGTQNLKATDGHELPEYLKKNKTKYSNWIE